MEKIIFNENVLCTIENEELWWCCKENLMKDILCKFVKQKKIFGTTITVPLNFIVDDFWIDRLKNFLQGSFFNSDISVKSNEVTIIISKTNDLNKLKKDLNRVQSNIDEMKKKIMPSEYILDENKTVVWNRDEVNKINNSIRSDINLLNGVLFFLREELLNLFKNRVKTKYGISVSDSVLTEVLYQLIPHFNIKEAEQVSWKVICRKLNIIIYLFQCMQE